MRGLADDNARRNLDLTRKPPAGKRLAARKDKIMSLTPVGTVMAAHAMPRTAGPAKPTAGVAAWNMAMDAATASKRPAAGFTAGLNTVSYGNDHNGKTATDRFSDAQGVEGQVAVDRYTNSVTITA